MRGLYQNAEAASFHEGFTRACETVGRPIRSVFRPRRSVCVLIFSPIPVKEIELCKSPFH